MRCQLLCLRKRLDILVHLPEGFLGVVDNAGLFDKVIHGQRAEEACCPARRKDVVGPCKIVPERF